MTLLANRPYLEDQVSGDSDSVEVAADRGRPFSASIAAQPIGSGTHLRLERLSAVERARRRFAGLSLAHSPQDNGDPAERDAVEAAGLANLLR